MPNRRPVAIAHSCSIARWAAVVCAACLIVGCQTTRLHSNPRLLRAEAVTLSVGGIHRLQKVDKLRVDGRRFELESGRHLLEFYSRSRHVVSGLELPAFSTICYIELDMRAGHHYSFKGGFRSFLPRPSRYDDLFWRFHAFEALLLDETTGDLVEGLVCPNSCRALGSSRTRHTWMGCGAFLEAVSESKPTFPEASPSVEMEELLGRLEAQCKRTGSDSPTACAMALSFRIVKANLESGDEIEFIPMSPDDELPDAQRSAVAICEVHHGLQAVVACFAKLGWIPLP